MTTGIIIITHGDLAPEFLNSVEMILGPQQDAEAIAIPRGLSPEEVGRQISGCLASLHARCSQVLILTDMFGGTPTNLASQYLEAGKVEIMTGVNLPMVLKLFSQRNTLPLEKLTSAVQEAAIKGIVVLGDI